MRRFAPLDPTAIPRSLIESFRHSSVDASLKDLRTVSRRVAGFSTPYHNELQLLERIYYKGKNQHRSAMFWHKVLEIRRLGTRISEIDISGFVEDLHFAFYGTEERNNPKVLRSAWKQAPDGSSCVSLLRRLISVCLLVDQTRSRFRIAHEAFTQQMRTATFIPLAMSLISITSRLYFLASELRGILALLWDVVARILDTVGAQNPNSYPILSLPLDPFLHSAVISSSRGGAAKPERAQKQRRVTIGFTEDIGSRVSRDSHAATVESHIPKGSSSVIGQTLLTEVDLSLNHDDPSGFTETLSSRPPVSVVPFSTLPRLSCQVPEVTSTSTVLSHMMPPSEPLSHRQSPGDFEGHDSDQVLAVKRRKVKKVKKKHSDEIDDIFGL